MCLSLPAGGQAADHLRIRRAQRRQDHRKGDLVQDGSGRDGAVHGTAAGGRPGGAPGFRPPRLSLLRGGVRPFCLRIFEGKHKAELDAAWAE